MKTTRGLVVLLTASATAVAACFLLPLPAHAQLEPREQLALTGNALLNSDFSGWNEQGVMHWRSNLPEAVTRGEEGNPPRSLLVIAPADKGYVDVNQYLNPELMLPGDTIIFESDVYSDEPGAIELTMRVNFEDENQRILEKATHGGNGWQTLTLAVVVPDAKLLSVEFRIRLAANATAPARVRSARADLVPLLP